MTVEQSRAINIIRAGFHGDGHAITSARRFSKRKTMAGFSG
jgi:hypothetical protein